MKGRWPANTLLRHLSGCKQVGSKKVKRELLDARAKVQRVPEPERRFGTMRGSVHVGSTTETVPVWECAPGCPVAELDEQSGVLVSGRLEPQHRRTVPRFSKEGPYGEDQGDPVSASVGKTWSGDKGGASRFFKQIQMGDAEMAELMTIVIARKPLSESSVAKNVLKHGTGGINIDKCRIITDEGLNGGAYTEGREPRARMPGGLGQRQVSDCGVFERPSGRWPANTLLMHLSGCKQVGSKKVKNRGGVPQTETWTGEVFSYGSGRSKHTRHVYHFDPETGTETIDAWVCAPGCPVAELDQQSGERRSAGHYPSSSQGAGQGHTYFPVKPQGQLYADKGGASRFFQPVQSETNLISYLLDLVVPDDQRPQGCIAEPDAELALWKNYGADAFCAIVTRGTPTEKQAKHMLRVLKPGGHLLLISPASQPTGHTGMCRIEDVGFEIRDTILVAGEPGIMNYVPKASRSEREAGCHNLPGKTGAEAVDRKEGTDGLKSPRAGAGRTASHVKNHHPTCKPIGIMVKLLADVPKGPEAVWDPFLGSGTTGVACLKTGHDFVGVEREAEYTQIAATRIRYWDRNLPGRWSGATIKSDLDEDEPEETEESVDFMDWAEDQ